MPIDYDLIKNWEFPEIEHTYTEKDTIIYALSLGIGHDPLDTKQLQYNGRPDNHCSLNNFCEPLQNDLNTTKRTGRDLVHEISTGFPLLENKLNIISTLCGST